MWLSAPERQPATYGFALPFHVQLWMFSSPVFYPSNPSAGEVALGFRV